MLSVSPNSAGKSIMPEFDNEGNLTSIENNYGVKTINTYDGSLIIKKQITNLAGLTTYNEYEYCCHNLVTKEKNALGAALDYVYDDIFPDKLSSFENERNGNLRFEYYSNGLLQYTRYFNHYNNEIGYINYTYNDNNILDEVITSNGSIYKFNYDSYGNIEEVLYKNKPLISYEYYTESNIKKGLLKKKIYGVSKVYEYDYTSQGQLHTIHYNGTLKYTFNYDNFGTGKLTSIIDNVNNVIEAYEYDINNNLKKVLGDDYFIDYSTEGSSIRRTVKDKKFIGSYESVTKSKVVSPEVFLNSIRKNDKYYGTIFKTGDENVVSNDKFIVPYDIYDDQLSGVGEVYEGIPVLKLPEYCLTYTVTDTSSNNLEQGSVAYWFNLNSIGVLQKKCIFSVGNSTGNSSLEVYIKPDKTILLETKVNGTTSSTNLTDIKLETNKWNFLGLSFSNTANGTTYIMLNVNGKESIHSKTAISLGENPIYNIGHNNFSSVLDGYITALIIGKRKSLSPKELMDYYRNSKDFIDENNKVSNEETKLGSSNCYTINQDILSTYDIITLNGEFQSFNGIEPIAYDRRNISNLDINRAFTFDSTLKRRVFKADGYRLEYGIGLNKSGTIMVKAKTEVEGMKRYIFELKDSSNNKIGLYVGADNYLYLSRFSSTTKTTLYFTSNVWNTVGLSVSTTESSDSDTQSSTNTFRVYLNGEIYELTSNNLDINMTRLSLGRQFNETTITVSILGNYSTSYSLMGNMEMLAFNDSSSSEAILQQLDEELDVISIVHGYDEIGLLINKTIKKDSTSLLKHEYQCKKSDYDDKIFVPFIDQEKIITNNLEVNRVYSLTGTGDVLGITDTTFGSNTIGYDEFKQVTSADGGTITYDFDGNILSKYSKSYTYDTTYKNRLNSYDGNLLTYDSSNPYMLKTYKNMTFTFEGNRLVGIDKAYDDEDNEITYEYNARGQRVKKTIHYSFDDERNSYEEEYKYYYDGDLLITEITPQYRNDFLYDENGELYGLIYKNHASETSYTHYYVRDILKNIIGLVDSNGNLVVKYTQDVWGYQKSIDGGSPVNIGSKNPFRYKGYYYDVETNLFYVTSRYYSPELGRFIQPADVSNLNPSSINGLNLYSYANNNPIGIAYSSSGAGFGASGGMVSSLALGGSIGGGTIGGDSSSWFTTLPAVPKALKHISKVNDVFSAVSHSFMVGKYLFGNGRLHTLSYLDDMRMLGVNPAKGLSSLPKASWLNKIGYVFAAIDGAVTIYDNLQQGNSWGQALLDGALSFGKSAASAWVGGFVGANVGGMIGAALGSIIPIPGVGTFIGFVVGTGVGIVVSWFVDDVLGLLKDGLLDLIFD